MSLPVLVGNSAAEIGCLPWIWGKCLRRSWKRGFPLWDDQIVGVAKDA